MAIKDVLRRQWKWLLVIVPVAIVAVVLGSTYVYIHFIAPDPAPPLDFTTASASQSGTAPATFDGTWKATDGSAAGYRVTEVLNGQDNVATGRTSKVTGQLEISGTTVSSASISVDMTDVSSGEGLRDSQFKGRIMQTSQFPTATFELKSPVKLDSIPADGVQVAAKASGTLTLHGTAKDVTIDVTALRTGATIQVKGTVPIHFSDYEISNPSGGPASVGDDGEMEFLVVFTK